MIAEKILVVDDEKYIRRLLGVILKSAGYSVTQASGAREALELLEKERFRVAVVDIVMPSMDGIELTGLIRERHPDTEVIISSTMKDKSAAFDALRKGACCYVFKPFDKKELLTAVDKAKQILRLETGSGQLESLIALHKASRAMTSTEKLDDILDFILKVAVNTVRADGGSLMLTDKSTGELVVRSAAGSRRDKVRGARVNPGERVCGRAMETRSSILVDENVTSEPWFRKMKKYEEILTGMSVPMIIRGEVIGVINLKRTGNPEPFPERDLLVTEILAADTSITIERSSAPGV